MNTMVYEPEWVREDFVDFIGEKLHPTWAWKKVKAKLVAKRGLSSNFNELTFKPNHNFKANQFQAGQSVLVTLAIKGVRQQRSYSIVSIDEYGVTIAVKQQGLVSNALAKLPQNAVVELSQAQGDFVLNTQSQRPILFIASGSGITAIYAQLKQALKLNRPIALIYFSRDCAYGHELESLNQLHEHFSYHLIQTLKTKQHFSEDLLKQLLPDFTNYDCYACGASSMMHSIISLYKQLELSHQLKTEYFMLPNDAAEPQPVTFTRAQQAFLADSNLLASAEKAGLKPAHGCRMGICNTCSCTKVQGSVRNLLTGEVDHASNTQIKLCISQAVSPVVINL